MSEIKNTLLHELISRPDVAMEKRIGELEDISIKISQIKMQRKKRIKKTQTIQKL